MTSALNPTRPRTSCPSSTGCVAMMWMFNSLHAMTQSLSSSFQLAQLLHAAKAEASLGVVVGIWGTLFHTILRSLAHSAIWIQERPLFSLQRKVAWISGRLSLGFPILNMICVLHIVWSVVRRNTVEQKYMYMMNMNLQFVIFWKFNLSNCCVNKKSAHQAVDFPQQNKILAAKEFNQPTVITYIPRILSNFQFFFNLFSNFVQHIYLR